MLVKPLMIDGYLRRVDHRHHRRRQIQQGFLREDALLHRFRTFSGQQGNFHDLVHMLHKYDFQSLDDICRDLREVLFIVFGDEDRLEVRAVRCQQLFLEAADGQHPAPQRDFTRHGEVATDLSLDEGGRNCRRHGNSGRRPVLGDRPLRHVDMDIRLLVEMIRQTELIRPGADVSQCGLHGLLHHVTQLAGHDHFPSPFHQGNFNGQKLAADFDKAAVAGKKLEVAAGGVTDALGKTEKAGTQLGDLLAGSMLTEWVFAIPGIGYISYNAMVAGDIPFSMFYMTFLAILTLLGNLISDILYAVVDPRVRIA